MAQYVPFDSRVEVSGRAVLAVVDGMGIFRKRAYDILATNGIVDPDPDEWYLQKEWLMAFRAIAVELGPKVLFEIGKKIPLHAMWPDYEHTIKDALRSINVAYQMNHRGGNIGQYDFYDIETQKVRMICYTPYPCDFDWGVITAMANYHKPAGTFMVNVEHDRTLPCRNDGADICSYIITW